MRFRLLVIFLAFTLQVVRAQTCFDAANAFLDKDYLKSDVTFDTIIRHQKKAYGMIMGCQLPDDTLVTTKGRQVRISDYRNKILIIDFWSIYCPPCIKAIPSFQALQKKYPKDLAVLAVTLDLEKDVKEWLQKHEFHADLAPEARRFFQRYSLGSGYPLTFLLDKQGKIIHIKSGGQDDPDHLKNVYNEFSTLIDKALKQE